MKLSEGYCDECGEDRPAMMFDSGCEHGATWVCRECLVKAVGMMPENLGGESPCPDCGRPYGNGAECDHCGYARITGREARKG